MRRTTTNRHPKRTLLSVLISLGTLLPLLPLQSAGAHGTTDQGIRPIPPATTTPCDTTNFPGYVLAGPTKALDQEFVPSVGGVAAIDVCLNVLTPATNITVSLRQLGAGATNPGPVIKSVNRSIGSAGFGFQHFEFALPDLTGEAATIPGTKYVIEIPPSQTTFQWRTTCGTAADPGNVLVPINPCSAGSPDRYPAGKSNFENPDPNRIGDFGFQVNVGHPAVLTGTIDDLGGTHVLCPASTRTIKATVSNTGGSAASGFGVGFYVSTDSSITKTDYPIGSPQHVNGVGANSSVTVTLPNASIPELNDYRGRAYVGMIIDVDNVITKANTNTTASSPVSIFCGAAAMSNLTLTVDQSQVEAGSYRIPLDDANNIPPVESIGFGSTGAEGFPGQAFPGQAFPGQAFPGQAFPGQAFDVARTAFASFPGQAFFTSIPSSVLANLSLADIPITGGWTPKLVNTSLADTPIQHITFAQFLALDPAPSLTAGEINFGDGPLKVVSLAGVATAGAPLTSLAPVGPGSPPIPWCTYLSTRGFDCDTYDVNPRVNSAIDLSLLGVTADLQWPTMPVKAMTLANTPLFKIALTNFKFNQTPARIWPVSAINNDGLFACDECQTLGEVTPAQFSPTKNVGDLIAALKDKNATLANNTLGDLLMGTLPFRNEWPLGALSVGQSPLYAPDGEQATYHARFTSIGTAPVVDPVVKIVPPPGFLALRGTSKMFLPAGSETFTALDEPDPSGAALAWRLRAIVEPGTTVELEYTLVPGLQLGIFGSRMSVHTEDQFGPVDSNPLDDLATVSVLDNERVEGQGNDSAQSAPIVSTTEKRIGFISSATDVDTYRLRVPTGSTCDTSVTGTSSGGCKISVSLALANISGQPDFDIALFGPPITDGTQGAPGQAFPGQAFMIEGDTSAFNTAQQAPAETVQDFPGQAFPGQAFPGQAFPGQAFSTTRGSSSERITATTTSGQDGYFTIQVWGYNGSTGPHPYVLGVDVTPPPPLPPCPARSFPHAGEGVARPVPAIPTNVSTLILVNQKRMGDLYGAAATATLMNRLVDSDSPTPSFVSATSSSVNGFVYAMDEDPDVSGPLAAWDASPCDVTLANQVVTGMSKIVQKVRAANPNTFSSVLILGTDEVSPSVRIADQAPMDEQSYTDSLLQETGPNNNAQVSAAANRTYLSDDALSTDEPIDLNGRLVFVPKWSVGRLVETPQQIKTSLDAFVASSGLADQPRTGLVTGYSFATDGAIAAADALSANLGVNNVAQLICDSFTAADLKANLFGPQSDPKSACLTPSTTPAPPPVVADINGHADNFRIQPPSGDELVTTADVPASYPLGNIIFGVGCHFGTSIPNTIVANPTTDQQAQIKDWPETFTGDHAAVLVANSGYGYGDTESVALSEKLMEYFAQGLDGTKTTGQAFVDAKRAYFLNNMGMFQGYDEKVLQEAMFYGIPSFKIAASAPVNQSAGFVGAPTTLVTDPVTGLPTKAVDTGDISFLANSIPGKGTYYTINDEATVQDRHPIIPQTSTDATNTDPSKPGYRAIGFFPTSVTTTTINNNDPVIARAEYDSKRPELQQSGTFPTVPGAITSLGDTQRLLLWPAKFIPYAQGGKTVTGDLLLHTREKGVIYYSSQSGKAPRILKVDTHWSNPEQTLLSFAVTANGAGSTVGRVGVLVNGVFLDLLPNAARTLWTGTATLPINTNPNDVTVTAVSPAGVGTWANKGQALRPASPSNNGLSVRLCTSPSCAETATPTGGWYTTEVYAEVSPQNVALEYSLDGGPFTLYTVPVRIDGTRPHLFEARRYDTSTGTNLSVTESVPIDEDAPSTTVTSPQSGATFSLNQAVSSAYFCSDAGSGVQSCTAPSTVDTSSPGAHTFTVHATDIAGNSSDKVVSYTVSPDSTPPTIMLTRPTNGASYQYNSSVTAAFSCADTGGSGLTSCTATNDGVSKANGALISTTSGTHNFIVTAKDGANNSTTTTATYTVPGYTFDGFYSPIANPPTVNKWNGGTTINFNFRVYDPSGAEVKSTSGFSFEWRTIACTSPFAEVNPDPFSRTAASSGWAYDTRKSQFTFKAKTTNAWNARCRKFIVTLPDGSTRFAYIEFGP